MPLNRSQSQTTRWYQLCFVPTSSDSSDDSDVESVVLTSSTPTTTSSTWQELSPPPPPPPPPPPNPEPEIDWRFPPPQLPLPLPPDLMLHQHHHQPQLSWAWDRLFNIEVQQDRPQPPSLSPVLEGDKSGCSTNAMNGLSRVRVSEMDKLSLCPICMDEFKVCDQAYQLPCNHTYCSECILRWLDSSKTCAVCRLQLNGYSFDSINDNNDLNSQLEVLSLSPSPPSSIIHNDSPQRSEYFNESSHYLTPVIENSASGNTDEADYDSACDELGDSQEDGASHTASDTLI